LKQQNAGLIEEVKVATNELAKMQDLRERYEASTAKVKESLGAIKGTGGEFAQKLKVMQTVIGTLDLFPQKLSEKIEELNVQNGALNEDVERWKILISQFKGCIEQLLNEYQLARVELNRFKDKVVVLRTENTKLQANVAHFGTVLKKLEEVEKKYADIVPQLKAAREIRLYEEIFLDASPI
jgi:chromosome segregation ATPase